MSQAFKVQLYSWMIKQLYMDFVTFLLSADHEFLWFARYDAISGGAMKKPHLNDVKSHRKADISPSYINDIFRFKMRFCSKNNMSARVAQRIVKNPSYDPEDIYNLSNVCYKSKKSRSGQKKHRLYYKLCPICNFDSHDFQLGFDQTFSIEKHQFVGVPKFYADDGDYEFHMASTHGVYKNFQVAPQPMMGFSIYDEKGTRSSRNQAYNGAGYRPVIICPLANSEESNRACLAEFDWDWIMNPERMFMEYFLHIWDHFVPGTKPSKGCINYATYSPKVNGRLNYFLPINPDQDIAIINTRLAHLKFFEFALLRDRQIIEIFSRLQPRWRQDFNLMEEKPFEQTFSWDLLSHFDKSYWLDVGPRRTKPRPRTNITRLDRAEIWKRVQLFCEKRSRNHSQPS